MKNTRRIAPLLVAGIIAATIGIAVNRHRQATTQSPSLPVIMTLSDFSLIDQDNRPVTLATLRGAPFVLDFIFTSCTSFCADMTKKMKGVRDGLGADSPVRTISISVDPETDRPPMLKRFATTHQANDPRWLFLTGERRTIGALMQSLYLAPSGDPAKLDPTQHSSRFVLVDEQGRVRGFYPYGEEDARERLIRDARALASKEIE